MIDLRATILGIIQEGKASAGVSCGEPICQPCEDEADALVALFPVIDDAMVERATNSLLLTVDGNSFPDPNSIRAALAVAFGVEK